MVPICGSAARRSPRQRLLSQRGNTARGRIYAGGMTERSAAWPKHGPASYFPSIEQKYGRTIAEWQQVIRECGLEKHMEIVNYLKDQYSIGHGHANALVGWTLAGNIAP